PSSTFFDDRTPYQLGAALALVDSERQVVSLDLITTFPERNEALQKVDPGPISLRVRFQNNGAQQEQTIGPVAYDQTTYESTGGVVDVPFADAVAPLLPDGQLVLVLDSSGDPVLTENESNVQSDDRGIYLQDASCSFKDATVTGIELPGQDLITNVAGDPLIGATVNLNRAVMVDVDPEGILGTQIFCDQFKIDGEGDLLCEGPPSRFYSRWLNFRRNLGARGFTGASAVWQAAISLDELNFVETDSAAMAALKVAAESQGGLAIRFCIYLLSPVFSQTELAQNFANGEQTQNPAVGRVL
ncbi:unnamed protein product, partial [marine sediment metagenome]